MFINVSIGKSLRVRQPVIVTIGTAEHTATVFANRNPEIVVKFDIWKDPESHDIGMIKDVYKKRKRTSIPTNFYHAGGKSKW